MMTFTFENMSKERAQEIITWHYEGVYSFYDMTADEEDLKAFLNPSNWGHIFSVLDKEGALIGFFSYSFKSHRMEIGLGLKPEITGRGLGLEFLQSGIKFGIQHFSYTEDVVDLAVTTFNKRAIKVYHRAGFEVIGQAKIKTNGGIYDFIKMRKNIS